jgi:hypothetical protein
MIPSLFFESYAPGMKAKLDPTYRRRLEESRQPDRAELLGKIALGSRRPLAPFTTVRKPYKLFSR